MCHGTHHKDSWSLIWQLVDKLAQCDYTRCAVGEPNPLAVWWEVLGHRTLDDLHSTDADNRKCMSVSM